MKVTSDIILTDEQMSQYAQAQAQTIQEEIFAERELVIDFLAEHRGVGNTHAEDLAFARSAVKAGWPFRIGEA